jgi:hypothetical protein
MDVDDPKEFLRVVAMPGRGDPLSPGWLYRGERDADFPVLPSVFRRYLDASRPTSVGRPFPLYADVVLEEVALLRDFMELADQVGLPIPGSSGLEHLRETIAVFLERSGPTHRFANAAALWPTSEFIPLMALARHHGLPTRLMDCSYSAHVAAYFAAEGAAAVLDSGSPADGRLAVWRIASECVSQTNQPRTRLGEGNSILWAPGSYMRIGVPRAGNDNLLAQDAAVLLSVTQPDEPSDRHYLFEQMQMRIVPLNDHLGGLRLGGGHAGIDRVTLPISKAPELLYLLAEQGVHGAKLFPGYAGVARAVRERRLWRTPRPET